MNIRWKIVKTKEELHEHTSDWLAPFAADVETYGTDPDSGQLLGISFSPINNGSTRTQAIYIEFNAHHLGTFTPRLSDDLKQDLKGLFEYTDLIGHNFTYDKRWIDRQGYRSQWCADTRIAWHLSSAPSGPRKYSLKELQTDVLGWSERGDAELAANVKAKGGSLSNGDHYLADPEILAKYACLDTYSTARGWVEFKPFFDRHEYHWMLKKMMDYNELLERNTTLGVLVDQAGMEKAHKRLSNARDAAKKRLDKNLQEPIEELEKDWLDIKLGSYIRDSARDLFLHTPEKWKRFNWNSDSDKRLLFYHKLGNEVIYTTKGGLPATNSDAIKQMTGEWTESYLKYERTNTLVSNFTGPYLDSIRNNRIHPGFNICGTVSYRLSGFKPYLLNAPFDEKLVMKNFKVGEGWIGCHADLAAIEPTVTAHYSEDPHLLKVFRDGLGDIYLDLARGMFPNDKTLQLEYNPYEPITEVIKKRLSRQRKIAKIIHLAVSYTGTKTTVHRNLLKEGIELSLWEADRLVQAYWKTFKKVEELQLRLRELNRSQGYLRNVSGRVIRVPDPEYKDLFNRFIQSSGHDVLVMWAMEIDRLSKERGIEMRPVIVDIHDSTSWMCEVENKEDGKRIFEDALDNVNKELGLSVNVKMEFKYFNTLAGLKGDE